EFTARERHAERIVKTIPGDITDDHVRKFSGLLPQPKTAQCGRRAGQYFNSSGPARGGVVRTEAAHPLRSGSPGRAAVVTVALWSCVVHLHAKSVFRIQTVALELQTLVTGTEGGQHPGRPSLVL